MNDKVKEAIGAAGHRLGVLARSPGYELELTRLYEAGYLAAQKEAAEQKPIGYFYKDHNGGLREAFDLQFKSAHTPLFALPPDQSARIAELEAECIELKNNVTICEVVLKERREQLADMTKQRDYLLAALDRMASKYNQPHKEYFGDEISQDIANVKGE